MSTRELVAGLPTGVVLATLMLSVVLTSDVVLLYIISGIGMILLPLTDYIAVSVSRDQRKRKGPAGDWRLWRGQELVRSYLTAGLATLATIAIAIGLVVTLGGTVGTGHALVRWMTYASGPVSQPPITAEFLQQIGGVALLSLVVASAPLQAAPSLSIYSDRGPIGALSASMRVFRRRPRATIRHWARQWLLLATVVALLPIAVWGGAVSVLPAGQPTLSALGQPGTVVFAVLAVSLGAVAQTLRVDATRRFHTAVAEPALQAEGEPTGRFAQVVTGRRVVVVALLVLVVSGAGAVVRVTDVHPTPDVTQSIEGVSETDELLSIASTNLEWTSYEWRQRIHTETVSRLQPLNGSTVLDRSNESASALGVSIAEQQRREYAEYTESNWPDRYRARGWYWTDVGRYTSKHPDRSSGPIYEPSPPPSREHFGELWGHAASWNGSIEDTWKPNPYNGTELPLVLEQPVEERQNLSVLSRNESSLVLGIEDPRLARDCYLGEDGPFQNADRGFVGQDGMRAVEALRSNGSLHESVVVHDASVRVVFDTATGRLQRVAYRHNSTRATRTHDRSLDSGASEGNQTNVIVSRTHYRETNTYTDYETATVDRPAGVPGPLGHPRPRMQALYLLDYLRY
ncbi:hypothetical protein SVXHr_0100 [Halorhabdus sp. SVX81]|nr:hypothetical protein SVXHr_0100 [Halorhabdus sp. SVX81]